MLSEWPDEWGARRFTDQQRSLGGGSGRRGTDLYRAQHSAILFGLDGSAGRRTGAGRVRFPRSVLAFIASAQTQAGGNFA